MKEFHVYYIDGNARLFEAENIIALRWYLYNEDKNQDLIDCIAWETGDPKYQPSITLWEEDWVTCKRRHKGVMPGCFWTDWE